LVAFGAGVSANVGTLPQAAPGTRIEAAWRPRQFRVALDLELYLSVRVTGEDRPGVGGDFQLGALALRGCFLPVMGRFELGACAGAAGEGMQASGFGGERRYTIKTFWPALRAGGVAAYSFTPTWALVTSVELSAPLARPRFVLADTLSSSSSSIIFRPSTVAGALAIGIEARFF
jgi:hypothetical protein